MKIFTKTCLTGVLLLFPALVWGAQTMVPYPARSFNIDYGGGYTANVTISGNINSANINSTVYSQTGGFNFNGFSADTTVSIKATGSPSYSGATTAYIAEGTGTNKMITERVATDKSILNTTVGEIRQLSNPRLTVRQATGETKTTGIVSGTESSRPAFLDQQPDPPSSSYGQPGDNSQSAKSPSDTAGAGGSGSGSKLVPCDGADCTLAMLKQMGANIYNYLAGFGAILAVGAIVLAGFSYIKSGGDPSAMKEAKQKIVYAITGLIILGASVLIVNTVLKVFEPKTFQKVEDVK
jgi:hypothetical protein